MSTSRPPILFERPFGRSVLLVEDDRDIRSVLAECLDHNGFEVTEAETAEAAAALLDRGLAPPVMVTDINLGPGRTGLWLADRVSEMRPMPVVFITGRLDMVRNRTLRPGEHILPKPFPLSALLGLLGRLVDGRADVLPERRGVH